MTKLSRFRERQKFFNAVKNFGGKNPMFFDLVEGILYAQYDDVTISIHGISPTYYPEDRNLKQGLERMGYLVEESESVMPANWSHNNHSFSGWTINKVL